jgi:hypothetical protein
MAVSELVPGLDIKAVNPVICFVRDEPVFGWSGDVMVCSTQNIVMFLTSRPRVFEESAVFEIAQVLSIALEAAPAHLRSQAPPSVTRPAPTPPDPTGPAPTPPALIRPVRRGRGPRFSQPSLPEPVRMLLKLAALAAVVAVAFQLDLPAKLGHLSSQAAQTLVAPTQPIGQSVQVPAMGSRPSLQVTAGTPVFTRSTVDGVRPQPGERLVAVPLRIQNTGDTVWTSNSDLRTEVSDQAGVGYSSDPAYATVGAGTALPATIRLRAGRVTSGFVVFEVPSGTRIEKVRVTVGPGLAKLLRWSVG